MPSFTAPLWVSVTAVLLLLVALGLHRARRAQPLSATQSRHLFTDTVECLCAMGAALVLGVGACIVIVRSVIGNVATTADTARMATLFGAIAAAGLIYELRNIGLGDRQSPFRLPLAVLAAGLAIYYLPFLSWTPICVVLAAAFGKKTATIVLVLDFILVLVAWLAGEQHIAAGLFAALGEVTVLSIEAAAAVVGFYVLAEGSDAVPGWISRAREDADEMSTGNQIKVAAILILATVMLAPVQAVLPIVGCLPLAAVAAFLAAFGWAHHRPRATE